MESADYYAFRAKMRGRKRSLALNFDQRFGFNRKEQSHQTNDQTNYDYGFRIYNAGIGRFLSVDPLTRSYPMLTPYQFASNTPIQAIDLDGLEAKVVVTQVGQTSEGPKVINSYELEPNSGLVGTVRFNDYANQTEYGTRGTLKVVEFVDPIVNVKGEKITKVEALDLSLKDRLLNMMPGENTGTEMKGGIEFYKENGQGKETRYSEDADIGENIDLLENALGVAGAASGASAPSNVLDAFKLAIDAIQTEDALKEIYSTSTPEEKPQQDSFICKYCNQKVGANDTVKGSQHPGPFKPVKK